MELLELTRNLQAEHVVTRVGLTQALEELLDLIRTLQSEHVDAIRHDLLQVLMSREVSLTPPATLTQARRLATHRDALLATPVLTHDTLLSPRSSLSVSCVRTGREKRIAASCQPTRE